MTALIIMNNKYGEPVFGLVTEEYPVVHTEHGDVMGENREGVAIFRGIPYGWDCGYEHRFLAPQPAADWTGVRDCTRNGHIAMQTGSSIAGDAFFGPFYSGGHPEKFGVKDETCGEDCLVLNVLTPGTDDRKRPVMVWLHGGGFSSNSGSLVIGGDRLVREEDVVLVGVNHRLTIFGYMYLGAFDEKYKDSGNAGMLDLVLALKWIRANIDAFGGDPENVTIFGESGGGMKINTLMAMEEAKGLFRRAIMESGTRPVDALTVDKATELARDALKRLGVSENDLSPLLQMSSAEILGATGGFGHDGFAPVADNIHIPSCGGQLRAWEPSREIPVMLGCAEEELSLFSPAALLNVTEDQLRDTLMKIPEGMMVSSPVTIDEAHVDHVIEVFKNNKRPHMSADHIYQRIFSMGATLGGASWYLAKKRVQAGFAPVYQYLIRKEAVHPGYPDKAYAWHTEENPWVMRICYPEYEDISKTMAHAWAAFARTGDPSTETLAWPAFTDTGEEVMVFDDVSHVEKNPQGTCRKALEEAGIKF